MESIFEMYMLEIQRHVQDHGFEHVGYTNTIFRSKEDAANYYNVSNPHLGSLNRAEGWRSDCDPTTRLRAVVRNYYGEVRTINTCKLADMPVQTIHINIYARTSELD